ncbi:hypothetical protein SDC9_175613 [bioreactor metagenome]|uniref:Uncharacterized protein n=1 Tax=bioreactor metagenome TaxID=1076179 RepID=A0A645GVW7_9ZZZZ
MLCVHKRFDKIPDTALKFAAAFIEQLGAVASDNYDIGVLPCIWVSYKKIEHGTDAHGGELFGKKTDFGVRAVNLAVYGHGHVS